MPPDDDPARAEQMRARLDHLEKLGEALVERGFRVRLTVPPGRPACLHVMNPDSSALAENILAEVGVDGWWYWWSWAERIGVAEDVDAAADRVARVLSLS